MCGNLFVCSSPVVQEANAKQIEGLQHPQTQTNAFGKAQADP
jgi:hypothetical protein